MSGGSLGADRERLAPVTSNIPDSPEQQFLVTGPGSRVFWIWQ